MRVLFFDIDTLRSDHLGCYGYNRNTSPAIDSVAQEGVRFTDYYCPNAPCLPSRASLLTGQYGIRTGVVGHGGTAADMRLQGKNRGFVSSLHGNGLFHQFRRAGLHTVSFSTFAERHSAWWFNAGFNELYNVGEQGWESADRVTPHVLDWIERNGDANDWFLHINFWDPHTPYRTPADFGTPFADEPLPDDWITDAVFQEHLLHVGPHSANDIAMWDDYVNPDFPRHPGKLTSRADVKAFIDNYDCGIRYADDHIAKILDLLKRKGLYDEELAIIITSDHGESMGELGIYGEHSVADEAVCHIPLIIKWPGAKRGYAARGFHDNTDLAPTLRELLGNSLNSGYQYDGISFAKTLLEGTDCSKEGLVLTQCAHVCQRTARFDDYLYIRTVHGGYHLFPEEMLFNIKEDPHQQQDLARIRPDLCAQGARMILSWVETMMKKSDFDTDPLWTVMREGGPEHCRGALESYIKRLEHTPREYGIAQLRRLYPNG